jgi:hypothetical protein
MHLRAIRPIFAAALLAIGGQSLRADEYTNLVVINPTDVTHVLSSAADGRQGTLDIRTVPDEGEPTERRSAAPGAGVEEEIAIPAHSRVIIDCADANVPTARSFSCRMENEPGEPGFRLEYSTGEGGRRHVSCPVVEGSPRLQGDKTLDLGNRNDEFDENVAILDGHMPGCACAIL